MPKNQSKVTVAPGVTQEPDAALVESFVNSYFTAINNHSYQQYRALLDRKMRRHETAQMFHSNFHSSTDSRACAGRAQERFARAGTRARADASSRAHAGPRAYSNTGSSTKIVSYPAVSPNVVGVGGTTLTTSGGAYSLESAWAGSGGGISTVYG